MIHSCEGDAIPARKTGTEIIEEAFGGKLWPGVARSLRLSSSSEETVTACASGIKTVGLFDHSTIALFYLTDNFHGRIIPINLATKWILSVCGNIGKYARK